MLVKFIPGEDSGILPPEERPEGGFVLPPGVVPPGLLPPGVVPPGLLPPGVVPPGLLPPGVHHQMVLVVDLLVKSRHNLETYTF
jgi:hypothetical protein